MKDIIGINTLEHQAANILMVILELSYFMLETYIAVVQFSLVGYYAKKKLDQIEKKEF